MIKLMTIEDIEKYRGGAANPQGWPFQRYTPKGRSTCRCCGEKVRTGEEGIVGFIKWADQRDAYHSARVVLHDKCEPCDGHRTRTMNA